MVTKEYIFFCQNCDYQFIKELDWNKISKYKCFCPMCKNNKHVYRDFAAERVFTSDNLNGNPKTVGALADLHSKQRGLEIDG